VITGSILLALVAFVLLVAGLFLPGMPDGYYYSSIVASVLAGFALFAGLRHRPGAQLPEDDFDGPVGSDRDRAAYAVGRSSARASSGRAPIGPGRATGRVSVAAALDESRATAGWEENAPVATRWADDDEEPPEPLAEPPDEPPEQELTALAATRVARLDDDVVVIDGRPRYHLGDCLHLLGRTTELLPVMEAVELGFTPCRDCQPATTLLSRG
jgi:hypothetical protein